MAENNDFAMGYAMGASDNNNGGGFGMGDGWGGLIGLLIVASLFGGGWGMGFGGGFGGGGAAMLNGIATRADINEGFALQNITGGITGIQQGICDSTYALNNAISSGFYGVDRSLCNIGHQISDCCCQTQNAVQNVRYDMAMGNNALQAAICNLGRDITENANANTRSIMDFLVSEKLSSKDAQIAQLQNQVSQNAQTAAFRAALDASTAEIIRRTGNDCPVPAYVVPNPNCCYGNPLGVGYNGYGRDGGCGCGI